MRHRRRTSDRATPRASAAFGALCGAGGVALSAYAAHASTGDAQRWLFTAAAMALVHGVLLVAYVPAGPRIGGVARFALALGVLLFSGSLVAAHLYGLPTRLAPIGGSLLIAGWLLIAVDRVRG